MLPVCMQLYVRQHTQNFIQAQTQTYSGDYGENGSEAGSANSDQTNGSTGYVETVGACVLCWNQSRAVSVEVILHRNLTRVLPQSQKRRS